MAEKIINEEILPIEKVTYGDLEPKPKSYIKKIHENLIEHFGKDKVPDEITFEKEIKLTYVYLCNPLEDFCTYLL